MDVPIVIFIFLVFPICIDAQQFVTPAVDTNMFGNLFESVNFIWTYTTPDISRTAITCEVNLVNVIFKSTSAGATAAIQSSYVGRATAVDDTTGSPYRIGFKLNNLTLSDASIYHCSMSYNGGPLIRSRMYRFEIYESPIFINCLNEGTTTNSNGTSYFHLSEGGVLNSTCYVYGNPVPRLDCRTYDSGGIQQAALPPVIRNYTSYPPADGMLFYNVRRAVTKVKCIADGAGAGNASIERTVEVDYRPIQPTFTASTTSPISGSSVYLFCRSNGKPAPKYRFIRVQLILQTTLQDGYSTNYTIREVNYADYRWLNYKADFRCVAYNDLGEAPFKSIQLNVLVRPITSIYMSNIWEFDNITLSCYVWAANPKATLVWRDPGNSIIPHTNGNAFLPFATRNQSGLYKCEASNGIGQPVVKSRLVTVYYGPDFVKNNSIMELCQGQEFSFSCQASGNPIPNLEVYFNGTRLLVFSFFGRVTHVIRKISSKNFGVYTCAASVSARQKNRTIILKQQETASSVSNVKLTSGQHYIEVRWNLPLCFSNIKEITVNYRAKGGKHWHSVKAASTSDQSMIIDGLESGVEFEVRVVVVDRRGIEYFSVTEKAKGNEVTTMSAMSATSVALIVTTILFVIAIVLLVVWNLRARNRLKQLEEALNKNQRNAAGTYTDLQLKDINSVQQPYAVLQNPAADRPEYEVMDRPVYEVLDGRN